jgi:AcrR family transcriptional regulator
MKDVLAAQQHRSRETLARLLRATIEMLDKHGLSGATIPRIAASAGVAPASVYRRFKDRDALYRAAFLSALEQGRESAKTLSLQSFKNPTLDGVARDVVAIVLRQYRTHPRLLTALVRYMEDDTDKRFKKKTLAIISENFRGLIDLLLNFRSEIKHPDPERAVAFGLLTVVSSIETRALGDVSLWREILPLSDQELQPEFAQIFLTYLRTKPLP